MKVKSTSWHYRFYNFWWNAWEGFGHDGPFLAIDMIKDRGFRYKTYHTPRSLCSYFWFTVMSAFFLPLIILLLGLVIAVFALVLFPFFWLFERQTKRRDRKRREKWEKMDEGEYVPPQPNMLSLWLKARKDKVCPLIEVEIVED